MSCKSPVGARHSSRHAGAPLTSSHLLLVVVFCLRGCAHERVWAVALQAQVEVANSDSPAAPNQYDAAAVYHIARVSHCDILGHRGAAAVAGYLSSVLSAFEVHWLGQFNSFPC